MAKDAELRIRIKTDTEDARNDIEKTAGSFSRMGGALAAAFSVTAVVAGVTTIVDQLAKATFAAADLNETVSASKVIFGEASGAVMDFAKDSARTLAMTRNEAIGAANTFATMGKAAGLTGTDLAGFSTGLVGLATDLASFKNTSPEQAIEALGAALRGESEPIRAYGILLDDATLRQEALKLGITDTTKEALTPQQKVLAAQSAIFKQTADAQGDFERTSESLANQTKVLTAQFEDFKVSIGEKILPIMTDLANWINDELIPAFTELGQSEWDQDLVKTLTELKDDILPVLQPILDGLIKALKDVAHWFSENEEALKVLKVAIIGLVVVIGVMIAILASVGLAIGLVGAAAAALAGGAIWLLTKAFEGLAAAAQFVRDKVGEMASWVTDKLDALRRLEAGMWDWLWRGLGAQIERVEDMFNDLLRFVRSIPGLIGDALRGMWDRMPKPPEWVPIIGGRAFVPVAPMPMAAGIPRTPTAAPTSSPTGSIGWAGGTVINVNISHSGLGVDSPRLQRDIVDALNRYVARNGRTRLPLSS
jgi:hypothetical protein